MLSEAGNTVTASDRDPTVRAIVAYPGVMPAANQVARAFVEAGALARYETTLAYLPDAMVSRRVRALPFGLGMRLDRQLSRRALHGIRADLVHRGRAAVAWELARTGGSVIGANEVLLDRIWERMVRSFDQGVADRLDGGVKLVYGYEFGCLKTFGRAGQLGVGRVYDMAALHYRVADAVIDRQIAEFPEIDNAYRRAMRRLRGARNAHKQAEMDLADLVVANSQLTARTLIESGYPEHKVRVVPLGAPPVDPSWRHAEPPARVRFLYAGQIAVHKGVHHLLAAFKALGASRQCELVLAGQWNLPARFRSDLPASVRVLGSIPQRDLFRLYRTSHVLVFPTLSDGFGMVVAEALAHGLPVLTTRSAGACDLITHGVNGFITEAGNPESLAAHLSYCADHPADLWAMREAAEATAARNQWSDYRAQILATIGEFFGYRFGGRS